MKHLLVWFIMSVLKAQFYPDSVNHTHILYVKLGWFQAVHQRETKCAKRVKSLITGWILVQFPSLMTEHILELMWDHSKWGAAFLATFCPYPVVNHERHWEKDWIQAVYESIRKIPKGETSKILVPW